ncbi:MAG: pilus assembly protein PilM, partial [bacterium]|nr:pilus assembly protein PilM [bacterium]
QEGYINDKQAVVDALGSLRKELGMEFVSATLPEEKAYLFKTELPKDVGENLREAIELRLEENVPISAKDTIFDYAVIPGENKDHIDVGVSALPFKVVDAYLEVIRAAGLKPLSLSVEVATLSRALIPNGNLGTFMIVNIAETRTGLSIVSRGVVQFSLMVPIGGDALTEALKKRFSVGDEEAKKIKEERGFEKSRENMEIFFSLMNTVSAIKDEISKLLVYWQTHQSPSGNSAENITKIIMCGRDCNLAGFDEYLSLTLKIPVEVGNVWQNAFSCDDFIPPIPFLDSFDYATAIGFALPKN